MGDEGTLTICVLSPLLAGAYFGTIVNGVAAHVAALGGRVVAIQTSDAQLGPNYPWSAPPFGTPLGRNEIAGFVAVIDAANGAFLADIRAQGKPLVMISHHVDGLDCPEVAPDNAGGVAQAVKHLIDHGHTRIAFAGEQERGRGHDFRERHQAYEASLRHHGVGLDPDLFFMAPNSLEDGGDSVADAMLRANLPCTAVVASTDLIASGILRTLQRHGVRVPEQVALVGFDDRPFACQTAPALSSVRQDFRALGHTAARLVVDMVNGVEVAPGAHLVSTSFVTRESCGCKRQALARLSRDLGQSARDRLRLDLADQLAGAHPTAEQTTHVDAITAAVAACFEQAVDTLVCDEERLRRVGEDAYRAFPRGPTLYSVVECVQQYRRLLLEDVGYREERLSVLDRCVLQISIALSAADAKARGDLSGNLQESLREEYFVSLALIGMRGEGADPKSLGWLKHTQAKTACLALWEGDGGGQDSTARPLRVAGTYGPGVQDRLPVGTRLDATAFPPVGALTGPGRAEADPLLVLPVRTATRNWGFLAVASRPEESAATGGDPYLLWTALLGTALDHDALVEEIRASEDRYALAARAANDGLWDWDVEAGTVFYSARWKQMLGHADDEIGNSPEEWFSRVHPDDQAQVEGLVAECLEGRLPSLECEYRVLARDGTYRWALCRALAIAGAGGAATRMVGSLTDVTGRKELESRLRQAALYDSLTGLPNRSLFMDRLVQAMARAKRSPGYQFCVLFMDLDGFKMVNDTLGHVAGDLLLMKVAERITGQLRQSDTAVRFGGDEFAILLDNLTSTQGPEAIMRRLGKRLSLPYDVDGQEVVVTATIGLADSSAGYDNPEDMVRDADAAMYASKAAQRAARAQL